MLLLLLILQASLMLLILLLCHYLSQRGKLCIVFLQKHIPITNGNNFVVNNDCSIAKSPAFYKPILSYRKWGFY